MNLALDMASRRRSQNEMILALGAVAAGTMSDQTPGSGTGTWTDASPSESSRVNSMSPFEPSGV
jgi:hypothetical protein